ncbi:MAG: hypothetical protein H7A38_03285 [Chlamydiales bacterium]|nr:hypothetical protein [Chlamydiales bacterium]
MSGRVEGGGSSWWSWCCCCGSNDDPEREPINGHSGSRTPPTTRVRADSPGGTPTNYGGYQAERGATGEPESPLK